MSARWFDVTFKRQSLIAVRMRLTDQQVDALTWEHGRNVRIEAVEGSMGDNSTDARKVTGPAADGITESDGVIVVAGVDAVKAVGNMIAVRMWNMTAKAKVNKVGLPHRGCSSVRKFNEIYKTDLKSWADVLEVTTAALKAN